MKNKPNPTLETCDPLDTLLRESDGYIPDHGFTARVLGQLPPPRRRFSARQVLLATATLLGSALAVWLLPKAGYDFAALLQNWTAWNWNMALTLIPLLAVFGALGWGLWSLVKEEG